MGKREAGAHATENVNGAPAGRLENVVPCNSQAERHESIVKLTPVALGIKASALYVGVGRSTIYKAIKDGELKIVNICARTLLRVADLNDWVNGRKVWSRS